MIKLTNRPILGLILLMACFSACIQKTSTQQHVTSDSDRPNVILIMTDDQGFGDLGYNGNPHIKTPVLDKFAQESVRFNEFLVSAVCAPTRSALMTGRYTLRTGVTDTYKGGAMMASSEITIAEVLKNVGYKTGMIGKWHLGDNYPMRPEDQGFDYSLHHLSGGMGQWGDWPNHLKGNRSYFDPTLFENGKMVQKKGYCTDVFTDAAINFLEENNGKPFFLYLAYNAPHDPLQVPQQYYNMYKDIDPASGFENDDRPFPQMTEQMKEKARKVYAMVSNIDDNLGRLFKKMDELQLNDNTLVIFMTDNGPIPYRYLAGMRGRKSSVYEGGIHVPAFWKFPAFKGNRDIQTIASHFDVFPTLAEFCGAKIPTDRKIDGVSLLPLLKGEKNNLPERTICRYWTRNHPEKYKNMMIRKGKYKLVGNCPENSEIKDFELFDFSKEAYEQDNFVETDNKVATDLKQELDAWLKEMLASPNVISPPRPTIGTVHENPSRLNLNDVHFKPHEKVKNGVAYWKVNVAEAATFEFILHFKKDIESDCSIEFYLNDKRQNFVFHKPMRNTISLGKMELEAGELDIVPVVFEKNNKYNMPFYLEVKKLES